VELPPWLKIENIFGKLDFSGWFRFDIKKEINITVTNFSPQYFLPAIQEPEVKTTIEGEVPVQQITVVEEVEESLTVQQKVIVTTVNKIHALNHSNYDFEKSFRLALWHIKRKSTPDWFVTAAAHMANAIQTGDTKLGVNIFLGLFLADDDPVKKDAFNALGEKIRYCYERLQNLRHVDKSGDLEKQFITEYERIIGRKKEISNSEYEQIFSDFQNLLNELFCSYSLK
jgi:hypothetical protein